MERLPNLFSQPKNITHLEAYPASNHIETRCVNMIARLFNAPLSSPETEAVGVSTLGSSEAVMLSVLAAKRRWQSRFNIESYLFKVDQHVGGGSCFCRRTERCSETLQRAKYCDALYCACLLEKSSQLSRD